MNWMHVVGFLLMLCGFLTLFQKFLIALLLIIAGAVIFQLGITKATKDARERERQIQESQQNHERNHGSSFLNKPASIAPNKPTSSPIPDPLDSFVRYGLSAPSIFQNSPMVYRYPNISVSNVNRDHLREMVRQKNFEVSLSKNQHGEILLKENGNTIAKLEDKVQMCIDWIDKGLPVICQFAAFQKGKEKVALFFYKDQESALADNKCDIVKLTACMSADKQETIAFLEKGQKLFIDLDDNDKPYVRDIEYNPIGNLPAKYQKLYEEESICGVFFDHSETKISEDFNKADKEIPFVRIYLE